MVTKPTTVLKKVTDEIQTGEFKLDKNIGLSTIKTLKISAARDALKKYGKRAYHIKVAAEHPHFKDISFSFTFFPANSDTADYQNRSGDNICQGTKPKGELKDIIIACLSHESYAFQISKNRTTWMHAENNPEDGTYLMWHLLYYGKYSPRSKWRLPEKCDKEKLWLSHKCDMCSGTRCKYIQTVCGRCEEPVKRMCPVCKTPICHKHSHCKNMHLNLTPVGMFEGTCKRCGRKCALGEKTCPNCGNSGSFNPF